MDQEQIHANNEEELRKIIEAKGGEIKEEEIGEMGKVEEIDSTPKQSFEPLTDGIKVIVFQSESLLKEDHFVFLRHRNVELYDSGRGKIFYMIGDFNTESDAFKFMKSFIIPDKKYKGPFVVNFTNGILAVVNQ
jgi:hypothetical protein